jgi:hypothetical protein
MLTRDLPYSFEVIADTGRSLGSVIWRSGEIVPGGYLEIQGDDPHLTEIAETIAIRLGSSLEDPRDDY